MPAKTIEVEGGKRVSVQLRPAEYSGERSKVAPDEIGNFLLLGLPVQKGFSLLAEIKKKQREHPVN